VKQDSGGAITRLIDRLETDFATTPLGEILGPSVTCRRREARRSLRARCGHRDESRMNSSSVVSPLTCFRSFFGRRRSGNHRRLDQESVPRSPRALRRRDRPRLLKRRQEKRSRPKGARASVLAAADVGRIAGANLNAVRGIGSCESVGAIGGGAIAVSRDRPRFSRVVAAEFERTHIARNAVVGSARAARCAGPQAATAPVASSSPTTQAYISGSRALTSKTNACR
jgi:hypothetical protein